MELVAVCVVEIGRDDSGRFYVKPDGGDYADIYRAARGIRWDERVGTLYAPADWVSPPARIFQIICEATRDEYGALLTITPATRWIGVADNVRREIAGG